MISRDDVFVWSLTSFLFLIYLDWSQRRKDQSLFLVFKSTPTVLQKNFLLCSQRRQPTLLKYLSSPRVQHIEKKYISEAQPILGTTAQFLTLQASLFPVLQLTSTGWMQCENLSVQGLWKKGNKWKLAPKNQLPREEWECSLSGASTMCGKSEANIHRKL